jgi:tetratricopeptide (TPR) repeat protein
MSSANHSNVADLLKQAILHFNNGHVAEAAQLAEAIHSLDPINPQASFFLGQYHASNGELEAALSYLDVAISGDCGFSEADHTRAVCLMKLDKTVEAETAFKAFIDTKPDFLQAYINLGVLYLKAKRFREALGCMDELLSRKNSVAVAHFLRGECLRNLNENRDAVFSYRQAISIDTEIFDAHLQAGILLKDDGLYSDALVSLRTASRLRPDNLYVTRHLAQTLLLLGEQDEGLRLQDTSCGYLEFYPTGPKQFVLGGALIEAQ